MTFALPKAHQKNVEPLPIKIPLKSSARWIFWVVLSLLALVLLKAMPQDNHRSDGLKTDA
jgi:hypothetical protein